MDGMTISAASGLRSRMESLEMLANNIANQATAGFKADREFNGLYLSQAAAAGANPMNPSPATLPVVDGRWTDFSPGALTPTGNATDLAISGEGFFTIAGPSGPLYTRNGSFRITQTGELTTSQGWPVLDSAGQPIRLDAGRPFEVAASGSVLQDGAVRGELGIVRFAQPWALRKQAGVYFSREDPSVRPEPAPNMTVRQGSLEGANFEPAEAAVRLVSVMRQFEMLQKAMQLGGEMNRKAVEDVARVGS